MPDIVTLTINPAVDIFVNVPRVEPTAKLRFNLLITGVTIVSATCIAVLSGGALVRAAGGADAVSGALADVDTTFVGYGLVAFFAVVGLLGLAVRRPAGEERR